MEDETEQKRGEIGNEQVEAGSSLKYQGDYRNSGMISKTHWQQGNKTEELTNNTSKSNDMTKVSNVTKMDEQLNPDIYEERDIREGLGRNIRERRNDLLLTTNTENVEVNLGEKERIVEHNSKAQKRDYMGLNDPSNESWNDKEEEERTLKRNMIRRSKECVDVMLDLQCERERYGKKIKAENRMDGSPEEESKSKEWEKKSGMRYKQQQAFSRDITWCENEWVSGQMAWDQCSGPAENTLDIPATSFFTSMHTQIGIQDETLGDLSNISNKEIISGLSLDVFPNPADSSQDHVLGNERILKGDKVYNDYQIARTGEESWKAKSPIRRNALEEGMLTKGREERSFISMSEEENPIRLSNARRMMKRKTIDPLEEKERHWKWEIKRNQTDLLNVRREWSDQQVNMMFWKIVLAMIKLGKIENLSDIYDHEDTNEIIFLYKGIDKDINERKNWIENWIKNFKSRERQKP
ncbi:MAG: hypothetical protein EOO43_07340 [Flavobacterium sp.]|nr:MAG: hypothetical protein EOO43_07340 [Flavobacterium sp.]